MRSRLVGAGLLLSVAMLVSWPQSAVPLLSFAQTPKLPNPPAPKPADAPFVKLPAEKTVKANRYFTLKADTNCASVKWIIPDGLEQLDPEIALKDKNVVVLIGDVGAYTVQAYGALADQASDVAACKVTIGTPPGPGPVDPFTTVLQTAFNLDADSDKASSLAFLHAVYAGMADQAKGWSDVKTNADALTKIKAVIEAPSVGLAATKIQNLRKAIAADFVKVFGTTATAPIDLTALSVELTKVANALAGVK